MFSSATVLLFVCLFSVSQCLVLDETTTDTQVLHLLVQLQNEVNTLQGKVSELEDGRCGCKGGKNVPAFLATLSTVITDCSPNQTIVFDSPKLNIGSGYDPRHGIFRAPVNGTYSFSANLSAHPHSSYRVNLVKNNVGNHLGYLYADAVNYWVERSTSVLTYLNAGDDVWINCIAHSTLEAGSTREFSFHSHFSGFLISAA